MVKIGLSKLKVLIIKYSVEGLHPDVSSANWLINYAEWLMSHLNKPALHAALAIAL